MNKIYGYARVSTKEQNLDRQINALIEYGVQRENIKTDKESGKDFDRPMYQLLKNDILREGDTLVIKELDRLGRNMEQTKEEWAYLEKQGISIVVIDTPVINTAGKSDLERKLISNIMLELLSYVAEKERLKIKQRQLEGIENAKQKGKHLGRPKAEFPILFEEYYKKWKDGEITATKCMQILNLKRTTFYKLVKQYEGENING